MTLLRNLIILIFFIQVSFSDKGTQHHQNNGRKGPNRRNRLRNGSNRRKIGKTQFKGETFNERNDITANPNKPQETYEEFASNSILIEVESNGDEYEIKLNDNDCQEMFQENNDDTNGNEASLSFYDEDIDEDLLRRLQVLGTDDRTEKTGNPITSSPTKWAGLVTASSSTHTYSCAGTLVGSTHVLTAGHCVHEGNGGDWFNTIRFYPRRNRLDQSYAISYSTVQTFNGWINNGNYDYDMAFIKLVTTPGTALGTMSFGYDNNLPTTSFMRHSGYPSDKTYGSLWKTSDYIFALTTHNIYFDDADTFTGNSGGMWYKNLGGGNKVLYGVHSFAGTYSGTDIRGACRFTQTKFDALCDFIDDCNICAC